MLNEVHRDGKDHLRRVRRERACAGRSAWHLTHAGRINNNVRGIIAECGGACACATCHVYVDDAWVKQLDARSETEESMLDAVLDLQPNSRLSCQIKVTDELDGLVVRLPTKQV